MEIVAVCKARLRTTGLPLLALALAGCAAAPSRAPLVLDVGEPGCRTSRATGSWRIQPDGVLVGRVTGLEDQPLKEALVTVNALDDEGVPEAQVRAGDGGVFRLDGQRPGRYWVRVRHIAHGIYSDTVEFVREAGEGPHVSLCYHHLN
jgi:Carboxypeptidase regulatory-like domain